MAPRKAAKHSDTEVVDRAAEAGDVSPPKRRKAVAKSVNKNDEERQIRLPRAAKSTKIEQIETTDTSSTTTKNTKTKTKTSSIAKNASASAKTNSKVKSIVKKNKEIEEKLNASPANIDIAKNTEEIEIKKTRTKATIKKAGMDVDEESRGKSKGKAKKEAVNENIENLEAPTVKKKSANIEIVSKDSNPKAKIIKKQTNIDAEIKGKGTNKGTNRNKAAINNETENNDKTEESIVSIKTNKKSVDDKSTKITVTRKKRGRKNEINAENISKDDGESKTIEESSSELIQTSDNENQEIQNNQSEETESIQTKKGRNVKKKETLPKKIIKMRGKTANRNTDAGSNEDDTDVTKTIKEIQKKTNKEFISSIATTKRGRGKTSENNSSEILNSNNNVQKSSEEDIDKKLDSEKEETNKMYIKMSGTPKKTDETLVIKNQINENNVISTSVHEEEI
ncbi:myb-like protein X [Apis laboriosa]|uniref:myb-like protein X n=1 Tax=Apis laboriosa TaxID=183418 RepID=UPI001CC4B7F8|nr:myb-like protein X [Apis laboriosa]XP_043797579.1 myb-like protein X [Apis laboriosa]